MEARLPAWAELRTYDDVLSSARRWQAMTRTNAHAT
jgi:hypothetical protein